ncbi:FimV family protein [Accumulibacter sp.]|nr:hypothetical protein [Accumulibacter sp.]MCM8593836.1 hypothetical protein [Accumulibacter sp.]MDS4047977.1 hypothetical protein [Accumulibacter sp.]
MASFLLWRAAIVVPLAWLAAGDAAALGLGQMTVLSRLGARFEAEVQLVENSGGRRAQASCFRLGQAGNGDIPALTRASLTVEQGSSGLRLRIVSDQTINDPVLQVRVHAGCGAEVVRNYLVLVDPPIAPRVPGAGRPANGSRAAGDVSASRWAGQSGGQLPGTGATRPGLSGAGEAASVELPGPRSDDVPKKPGKPLPRQPTLVTRPADRLVLSIEPQLPTLADGEFPALRLSSRLSAHLLNRFSESQRALLRIEYKLLSAIHTQAEQQLAVAEQVRRIEATIAELEQRAEGQARLAEIARSAAPAAMPAATSRPVGAPSEKGGAVSERARPARTSPADEGDWWVAAGLLLVLVSTLAWWLRRRSVGRSPQAAVAAPAEQPPSSGTESLWELDPGSAFGDQDGTGGSARSTAVREDQVGKAGRVPGGEGTDDAAAVLDLAEIMLSFGRLKAAEQALVEFIDRKPAVAVGPWLKLLEVYRQSNQREAFDALAIRLTRRFNVAPVDWDTTQLAASPALSAGDLRVLPIEGLLARLPAIGRLVHVRQAIARTWGSPECLAYLERLLRDNRHGERTGFSLRIVHEILFLSDLLQSRLPGGD